MSAALDADPQADVAPADTAVDISRDPTDRPSQRVVTQMKAVELGGQLAQGTM